MRLRSILLLSFLVAGACDCGDDDNPMPDGGHDGGGMPDAPVSDPAAPPCMTAGLVEGASDGIDYPDGITGNGDLAIENGLIRAVFSDPGTSLETSRTPVAAASGGILTDLHFIGESDHMNELWQLAGTSQSVPVVYTSLSITEQDDMHVIVEATGYVKPLPKNDGTPYLTPDPGEDLRMTTTYELRCEDPRVRMRSTLENGTANPYVQQGGFQPMDVMLWGQKSLEPFCPNVGQGTRCTQFDFSNPLATIVHSPYVGSTGSLTGDTGTFAFYSDVLEEIDGVHSNQLSVLGSFETTIATFMPGQTRSWPRVLVVGHEADAASALDVVFEDLEALGRIETSTVTGTVELAGEDTLSSDPYRRPLVVLAQPPASGSDTDPTTWTPMTMARVAEDGTFTARVPAGTYSYEVRADGRDPFRGSGGEAAAGTPLELGTITVPEAPVLDVEVTDGAGAGVVARVTVLPADSADPLPSFGSPWGAAPAGNLAFTDGDGNVSLHVPSGTYEVYATHGIGYSLGHETVTVGASGAMASLTVEDVDVVPDGYLTGDFHVHSAASFDSSLPPEDRVRSYLAEGVDLLVSTDHDVIFDLGPGLTALEAGLPPAWQGRVRTFVGIESTQFVPWESFPHTIGHNNAFPVEAVPGAWKNGAPLDEYIDPGTLYELLRELPSPVETPLVQLNHGRSSTSGQIFLGYFDSCGFVPTADFDPSDACWSWTGPMGTRPWDIDAMEVINGNDLRWIDNRRDWYAILLNAPDGRLPVGTANSDSHALVRENYAGYPVTVLRTDTPLAELDDAGLVAAMSSGSVGGSMGVVVWFELVSGSTRAAPGHEPAAMSGDVDVEIRVAAPPWVPVEEIRVVVGGEVRARLAAGTDWTEPTDPMGTAGAVRYTGTTTITLPPTDTFVTVEAGVALPPVADVDGDGRADATDNDTDGDIDMDDVDAGGIVLSAVPEPFGVLTGGARPFGFANPVFVDTDGGGWTAPMRPLAD